MAAGLEGVEEEPINLLGSLLEAPSVCEKNLIFAGGHVGLGRLLHLSSVVFDSCFYVDNYLRFTGFIVYLISLFKVKAGRIAAVL